MKKYISIILSLTFIMCMVAPATFANGNAPKIKNIIYMIPDGGGMVPFEFANAINQKGCLNARGNYPNSSTPQEGKLKILDYVVAGVTTYCSDSEVTDSAAAGTALSSGYKTKKGYIGVDASKKPHATLLEVCKSLGK